MSVADPISVLEQAIQAQKRAQKVADLEIENKQLRETLEDYNNEFAEVKNQGRLIEGGRRWKRVVNNNKNHVFCP